MHKRKGYVCIHEKEKEIHFCMNEREGYVCLPVSEGYGLSLGKTGMFVVTGECGTVVPWCDIFVTTTVRLWRLPLKLREGWHGICRHPISSAARVNCLRPVGN